MRHVVGSGIVTVPIVAPLGLPVIRPIRAAPGWTCRSPPPLVMNAATLHAPGRCAKEARHVDRQFDAFGGRRRSRGGAAVHSQNIRVIPADGDAETSAGCNDERQTRRRPEPAGVNIAAPCCLSSQHSECLGTHLRLEPKCVVHRPRPPKLRPARLLISPKPPSALSFCSVLSPPATRVEENPQLVEIGFQIAGQADASTCRH